MKKMCLHVNIRNIFSNDTQCCEKNCKVELFDKNEFCFYGTENNHEKPVSKDIQFTA